MYAYESWTIKMAEYQRIDAFKLWCWRRLLRVPWTASWSNQSILREINGFFIGRTDAEPEAAILWPHDVKSWLIGKDPDAGKDWRQEEKGTTEDEIVGWHHWLDGQEFEQALGDSEGPGKPGMLQFLVLQRVAEQQLITKGKAKNWTIIPEKSIKSNKENRSITQHLTLVHN